MKLLVSRSILLFVTLSLFNLDRFVNTAPVDLQVQLSPRVSEADLTVCGGQIKLRKSGYADTCKNPNSLRPGVVQMVGQGQYEWATSAQMSIALKRKFNLGRPTQNGHQTLIQCDHLLEIQHIKFLFDSKKPGAALVCNSLLQNSIARADFFKIINGPNNLFNLDATLNNYKGKIVTSMIATAQQAIANGKPILPVLKEYSKTWAYSGLAEYYRRTGPQQEQVANELWDFLNANSGGAYGLLKKFPAAPGDQIQFLTRSFEGIAARNIAKRSPSRMNQWFTLSPRLAGNSFQNYAAVGTTSSRLFEEYIEQFHPSAPAEDEDTDEADQMEGIYAPPTSLKDPRVFVVGGLEAGEETAPACVRPRDSNDEAALSCSLGGGSSPSNHSGILPLSSGMNSSLSESNFSEGSLDSSSIKVLPTSTLLDTEAAQTPVNTFNRVNTLDPVNTLNRAQTFDSRPTSPTMNGILPVNPQLKPTLASTSINRFPNAVNTPIYRQSLNNGLNQNHYHSTLPFSRIPQAIPTQVSTRKFPISSKKVFSTRRPLSTTPVGSLPFRPIKNSLAFGPTVTLGSVRGLSRYKLS